MMKRLSGLFLFIAICITGIAQDNGSSVYIMSFKDLGYSTSHQFQVSAFSHNTRSAQIATYYISPGQELLPTPVYNRAYSFFTLGYQPGIRIVEFGSKLSLSLKVPVSLAFSTVDLRTKSGNRYSFPDAAQFNYNSGTYTYERPSAIGYISGELGGLIGFDLGAQSTIENTNEWGLGFSAGYNLILAPIFMDGFTDQTRADYKGDFSWATMVGQIEIHKQRVSLIYMCGIRPIRVHYTDQFFNEETVLTNAYQRVSLGFKLGR